MIPFFTIVIILWIVWRLKYYFVKKDIKGETVLITGAASGMGRSLAIKLSKLGTNLVLWDINEEGLKETESEILKVNSEAKVSLYKCDLTNRLEIYEVADQVKRDVGDVDILINNAGYVSGKSFLEIRDEQIMRTMDVNINSHFWTLKKFLPSMIERNHGHIVSIISMAGHVAVPSLSDYSASKFAAVGLIESIRTEIKKKGIKGVHTTSICPFFVNTGMFEGAKSKLGFILPILDQEYVTDRIISAILSNEEEVLMPTINNILPLVRILPIPVQDKIFKLMGVHDSMDDFIGRAKKDA